MNWRDYNEAGAGTGNGSHIEEIRDLLGRDVVLLPVPCGKKRPVTEEWQKTTIAAMDDPAHLRAIASGNVGVLLGNPSGGLCTIDLDADEMVEPFLDLNPRLRETLRTKGNRGCNLWARVAGDFPRLGKIKDANGKEIGEWRADGGQTIIYGTHPDTGEPYSFQKKARPVEIAFGDIVWPEDWRLPWKQDAGSGATAGADELQEKYGRPFYVSEKGGLSINEPYWAGLYAHENLVIYEPDEKTFYFYNAGRGLWVPRSTEVICSDISSRILAASRQANVPDLEKKRTLHKLNAIVGHLKGIVEKRGVFASRRAAVHVANGVIVFGDDGPVLTEFAPIYYSRNQSPIIFDENAECPRFLNELLLPAVSPEDVLLLQRWAGLALLGLNHPQRILILDGNAGTGKTTLAAVIQLLVGPENCTQLRTDKLGERFELYRYRTKTLLAGADVPGDFLMRPGAHALKALVGGDLLDAEGKNLNTNCPLRGTFNVIITANERLRVALHGDVGAWRRRLIIVRYEGEPPKKKIPNFAQVLIETEGSGILLWAIEGLVRLVREMKDTGDFVLTPSQLGRVDALLAESDSLHHFLCDRVQRVEGGSVTKGELIEAYAEYCADKGWNAMPITVAQRELPKLMLEHFQVVESNSINRDGKNQRGFRNVTLHP